MSWNSSSRICRCRKFGALRQSRDGRRAGRAWHTGAFAFTKWRVIPDLLFRDSHRHKTCLSVDWTVSRRERQGRLCSLTNKRHFNGPSPSTLHDGRGSDGTLLIDMPPLLMVAAPAFCRCEGRHRHGASRENPSRTLMENLLIGVFKWKVHLLASSIRLRKPRSP